MSVFITLLAGAITVTGLIVIAACLLCHDPRPRAHVLRRAR